MTGDLVCASKSWAADDFQYVWARPPIGGKVCQRCLNEAVCFIAPLRTYGLTAAQVDLKDEPKYRAWRAADPFVRAYAELAQFSPTLAQDWMCRFVGPVPLQACTLSTAAQESARTRSSGAFRLLAAEVRKLLVAGQ